MADLSGKSLEELAQIVRAHRPAVVSHIQAMFERAVTIGEALTEARERLTGGDNPRKRWAEWLGENCNMTLPEADQYQFWFHFQDRYDFEKMAKERADIVEDSSIFTLADILTFNPVTGRSGSMAYPTFVKDEVLRLYKKEQWSKREIGRRLGIPDATIMRWCDPEADRKKRKAARQRRKAYGALAQKEAREAAKIKAANGGTHRQELLSRIRKACEEADKAILEISDNSSQNKERQALRQARDYLYKAEQAVNASLGIYVRDFLPNELGPQDREAVWDDLRAGSA